jgi:1-hydroxycarotenoid 3,4-desaturase
MLNSNPESKILVIGAGIGGLAAALRLASAGCDVLVVERASGPGGKLRTVPSVAGPVDAGPTVLTMLPVFEALFADANESLSDYLDLTRQPLLARHWWPDGSSLDLFADIDASASAIREFAGPKAEREFRAFQRRTATMFRAFEGPVMQSSRPGLAGILKSCATHPGVMPAMMPGRTLWSALSRQFSDARLTQLFARYATYVGGSPFESPALLSLIWQAEAAGVWTIDGGMRQLAEAFEKVAMRLGVQFSYGHGVDQIRRRDDGTFNVALHSGETHHVRHIVFNGDPAALSQGLVGPDVRGAVRPAGTRPRSLSAWVWSFAAEPRGRDLAHHNVFFNTHYRREFSAISKGRMPGDAALYVCAQDRGHGDPPTGPERFEIILNGAPVGSDRTRDPEEYMTCLTHTFDALSARGLDFTPLPERPSLTTPHDFARRFPGSAGSLYGRSPHGMMASFHRPTVQSLNPGLFLAGGGVHPGAGLPMAATSGRLAAEAILKDLASTSRSRRTVMPGGMSTDYRTAAATASRSSPS